MATSKEGCLFPAFHYKNMFLHMVGRQQAAQKTCNAILLLDGWQWSDGVMLEMKTAINCGHRVLLESDLVELEKKKT